MSERENEQALLDNNARKTASKGSAFPPVQQHPLAHTWGIAQTNQLFHANVTSAFTGLTIGASSFGLNGV